MKIPTGCRLIHFRNLSPRIVERADAYLDWDARRIRVAIVIQVHRRMRSILPLDVCKDNFGSYYGKWVVILAGKPDRLGNRTLQFVLMERL